MQEAFYPEEQISLGSSLLEPIVSSRHMSKGDILRGCSLGLIQLTLLVLPNLL